MDQLPRLGKRELICLLLFTCNYVVSVLRGFLFLWVLGMGYVILLWHSLSLPYNYFTKYRFTTTICLPVENLIYSFIENARPICIMPTVKHQCARSFCCSRALVFTVSYTGKIKKDAVSRFSRMRSKPKTKVSELTSLRQLKNTKMTLFHSVCNFASRYYEILA